jgi:hypothetical protein
MDAVIYGESQHQRRKDYRKQVEVTHYQGDHAEDPTEGDDQREHLNQGTSQAAQKQNQEGELPQQRYPGGQGDVLHGAAHLIDVQRVGSGDPGLKPRKASLKLRHGLAQKVQVGSGFRKSPRFLRHHKDEKLVVGRKEIALLA